MLNKNLPSFVVLLCITTFLVGSKEGLVAYSAIEISREKIIYVPDNFSRIQDAINNAPPFCKIVVRRGNYSENIKINKEVTIISEEGPKLTSIIGLNPEEPVIEILSNYVSFSGFTIIGKPISTALILVKASNITISNNRLLNGSDGIYLFDSSKVVIKNNLIFNNKWSGIFLIGSQNNLIESNRVENNSEGIILAYSSFNEVRNNSVNNNYRYGMLLEMSSKNYLSKNLIFNSQRNLGIYGFLVGDFINFFELDNKVNNKEVVYIINKTNMTIQTNAGFVGLINCASIVLKNFNLSNNFQSLLIVSSFNIVATNLTISNNWYGAYIINSNNVTIFFNDFVNNTLNVYTRNSTIFLRSKNKLSYEYKNKVYLNYLGNYWSDYSANNSIGGIGKKSYVELYIRDEYPLISSHYSYKILGVSTYQIDFKLIAAFLILISFFAFIFLIKKKSIKFKHKQICSNYLNP